MTIEQRRAEAAEYGLDWVECPTCHGNGVIFATDGTGQFWCTTCKHGEGGWTVPQKKEA